ncbi:20S proteasome subunit alpha 5 [Pancytospora philotis]|nr:20S proteasome subunit alpha 5 [Pancytospora philotis]
MDTNNNKNIMAAPTRHRASLVWTQICTPMGRVSSNVNTYNADGRIIQVEYAMKAINLGTTTIGVKLRDCVVLVSEKKLSTKLQLTNTVKKHFKIYDTLLCGISGISGDAPEIVDRCRELCIAHERIYNEQICAEELMEQICALALKFGEEEPSKRIFSRPFGVSILVAAYEKEPRLYSIDPSGSYLEYKARSIGSSQEVVEAELESSYSPDTPRDECIRQTLMTLKNVMKDPISESNVEVSCVDASGVTMIAPEAIRQYLAAPSQ